jgi:hypothetical protein
LRPHKLVHHLTRSLDRSQSIFREPSIHWRASSWLVSPVGDGAPKLAWLHHPS